MLEPPEMIMSLERSLSVRKPSASNAPMSPVWSQPPLSAFAVASADDLADLARRQRAVVGVEHLHLDIGARDARGAEALQVARMLRLHVLRAREAGDRHRRLALAVDLDEFRPEALD